ncbi:MAG: DNA-binding response regulator [Chloroflexi bacterium]|nr:MAG: DNA-binding response regulator [Chloroflexota bacterium]RLC93182.1 MAG: DNA-binding response regulator [Chloroflexota bacterium]
MEQVRVLLVDDHTLFRRGIADALGEREGIEIVGEASDGLQAIEKARELMPDVVVMDLQMPRCNGVEACHALQAELPTVNVLVLTVSDKESDLFSAIKAGAKGYLLKDTEAEELGQAVVHIAKGGVIVSPSMASKLLTEFKTGDAYQAEATSGLSQRETEILQEVAKGASNKEIASTLFISENTVKTHLRNILEKLHLANRSQAAAYAIRAGLVPIQDEPPGHGTTSTT